jgi:hypothetical protein
MPRFPRTPKLHAASLFKDLNIEERASFRGIPPPVLIKLPQDFQLYKWTGTSRHNDKGQRVRNTFFDTEDGVTSQFWAPWATMDQYHVPGFSVLRKRDRNVGGSVGRPQELARARFAVVEEWNEMGSLVKAQLKHPVWAFLGVCAMQPFSENPHDHRSGFFPGGNYQLVIPSLTAADIFKL